ncbi:MAG TPA: hypothetical protein VD998_03460 [Verrucomicrobiae bacterium]|nr:hypothetical protein [Verrucomicrobiae bacterium]
MEGWREQEFTPAGDSFEEETSLRHRIESLNEMIRMIKNGKDNLNADVEAKLLELNRELDEKQAELARLESKK